MLNDVNSVRNMLIDITHHLRSCDQYIAHSLSIPGG